MAYANCSFNHVALSVPSVEAAAEWYHGNFGFIRLRDDVLFSRLADPDNMIFHSMFESGPGIHQLTIALTVSGFCLVYPPPLNVVKVAYLVTGDGTGFELFEFIDPPYHGPISVSEGDSPEFTPKVYANGGFFHIAVTVDDVEATCRHVICTGGRKIGETIQIGSDKAVYLMDPWGNVIELLTRCFQKVIRGDV